MQPGRATPLPGSTDPRDAGPAARNAFERFFARRLRDERDLKFVRVAAVLTLCMLPMPVLFFAWAPSRWLALLWVPVFFATMQGRYTLMLHATMHRPIFKREHKAWELYIPWVLGPLFGHTPTSMYVHHMGMHHPENNTLSDLSTTVPYQRDRFTHWLHYWARFFFFGYLHLLRYLVLRSRDKLVRKFLVGELAWMAVVGTLLWVSPGATMATFVVPTLLLRVLMMSGNWAQHAFVDVDDPNNAWRNSTCLIDVKYNHKAYNDGYHIVHHLKPALHWTEMAAWFESHIEEFGAQDAIVFQGLGDNQKVWLCLMTGDYDKLARHLVDLPGAPARTHEEKIAFLKDRVRRRGGEVRRMIELEEAPALAAK